MTRLPAARPEVPSEGPTDPDHALLRMLAASDLHIFNLLAHAPKVFRGFGSLGGAFLSGSLSAGVRESATLRVAAILGSDYEWGHHVVAARAAGLSDSAIAGIRAGRTDELSDDEAFAVRFAAAVEGVAVDDGLWNEARARFDDASLVELVVLVGFYGMASRFVLALDVELDAGIEGLDEPA